MDKLPLEIIYSIFLHLSYTELHKLCFVNKQFQFWVEYFIFLRIKTQNESILIRFEDNKHIELKPTEFDYKNHVIEFMPDRNSSVSLSNTSNQQWSAYHRFLKIHFSGWFTHNQDHVDLTHLNPQDQAFFLHHYHYNALIQKTYELPSWNKLSEIKDDNNHHRYLGDKGLIVSMSYEKQSQPLDYTQITPLTTLPFHSYTYKSIASMPTAPKLNIYWIRVTLDWVLSGFIKKNRQKQIYKESFDHLHQLLIKNGCYKYNPLSEPILDYIVKQPNELPAHLLNYVKSHTHECHTPLSRLQHMLEGAGIDSQILWKYNFAQSFVVGNGLLCEEDIVRRIQDAEEEWRKKKKTLNKRTI